MRTLKRIGKVIWNLMILFSFIVNVILVIVLLVVGLTIFDIKKNIAQPLIGGLHSSFVGLNDATIDWTIPVRDSIQVSDSITVDDTIIVNDSIDLVRCTVVTIAEPVPVARGTVSVTLPAGLQLPICLDLQDIPVQLNVPVLLDVPVELDVPVSLDVRAVIPLEETQLHDPVDNLRLLFEPLVRLLYNLPDDFGEVGPFVADVLDGSPPNLLTEDPNYVPWSGYSQTAGVGYELVNEPMPPTNLPVETGIVTTGGIPALDEQLRPEIYAQGGPEAINQQAEMNLQAQNVPAETYDGDYGEFAAEAQAQAQLAPPSPTPEVPEITPTPIGGVDTSPPAVETTPPPPGGDMGIISTPSG